MFDPTTRAAYNAAPTPVARAQAVRDSLGSSLTVELRDGETLIYSGTFTGPLTAGGDGSLSADVLLSGLVDTAGTPSAATWTCRIRNGDGRWLEGSFGPGGRFTFSAGSLTVGQAVRLGVRIEAAGGVLPLWLRSASSGGMPGVYESVEVPNSKLSDCAITWAGPGTVPPPDTGTGVPSRAKLNAWNGAALKQVGAIYMIACSGGHGDYAGNEVNAITLNADVIAGWQELCPPSPYESIINNSQYYLDLKPASIHTYWSLQFDQKRNRLVRVSKSGLNMGAMPLPPEGWEFASAGLGAFDFSTMAWLHPSALSVMPNGGTDYSMCCSDLSTGDVYWVPTGGFQMYRYDADQDEWSIHGSTNNGTSYCGAALDYTRGHILKIGAYNEMSSGYSPRVYSLAARSNIEVSFGGPAAGQLSVAGQYPGCVYDPDEDVFWVMLGQAEGSTDGATTPVTLIRVDAGTWESTEIIVTGTPPRAPVYGAMGKLQYSTELGGLIIADRYTENLKFIRTR